MSSVSEDAMFKALLKNKPPQKPQTEQKVEAPVRKEIRETVPKPGSEDAMYRALLRNRPQQQTVQAAPKPQVRESVPAPVIVAPVAEARQPEIPVVDTGTKNVSTLQTDAVVESINNLASSVSMVHGLMKTLVVPLLILILLVLVVGLIIGK